MNARQRLDESRASRRFGFASLALWATVGLLLELAHAIKWSPYLDHPLRRELSTLAHAHGLGLALVVLAYAALGIQPSLSSGAGKRLRLGALLIPAGFLLATLGLTEADPGPAILAVPVGALLVLASLLEIARAAGRDD